MARSERWDVQSEGPRGDQRVVTGPSGSMGPAWAFRRYTESEGAEPYADWQARVTRDVFRAREALLDQGFEPAAVSVPGGDYGRLATNDHRAARFVRELIASQFGVGFVRDARNYPAYTTRGGHAARFEIGAHDHRRRPLPLAAREGSRAMRRALAAALTVVAVAAAGLPADSAEAKQVCAAPKGLSFKRAPGASAGKLSLEAAARRPARHPLPRLPRARRDRADAPQLDDGARLGGPHVPLRRAGGLAVGAPAPLLRRDAPARDLHPPEQAAAPERDRQRRGLPRT